MGQPVPAQAAGQEVVAHVDAHNHVFSEVVSTSARYYEEANSTYHFVYVNRTYKCSHEGCSQTAETKEQVGYEEHTMWGVAPSPHRASCLQCGYLE